MPTTHTPLIGLRLNAALSLTTGLALATMPTAIGNLLALEVDVWLRLLGIGLLAHAAALVVVAWLDDPTRWVRINLAMVVPYPFLMLALAATSVDTSGGRVLVVADGLAVAIVAWLQWTGVRRVRTARLGPVA